MYKNQKLIHSALHFFPQLLQQSEDRNVLRYVYYYLARILYDSDPEGLSPGGGIPTPNWDAVADIDVVGRVTRADVIPRVVNQLSAEATNADIQCNYFMLYHPFSHCYIY